MLQPPQSLKLKSTLPVKLGICQWFNHFATRQVICDQVDVHYYVDLELINSKNLLCVLV